MEKRNDFSDFLCNFAAKFRKDPELMDNGNSLIIITTMEQSIENLYKLDGRVPVGIDLIGYIRFLAEFGWEEYHAVLLQQVVERIC
jgi:hypothetical protein